MGVQHGNQYDNVLEGGNESDALYGYAGTDTLNGNGGNDILGPGSYHQQFDYVNGGAGFDVVSYLDGASVTVDLADVSFGGDGSAGNMYDVLTSIEGVFGSNVGKDTISGSDGYNELFGFGGDDLIEGRGGADRLDGGAGVDTASYASSTGGVVANLGTGLAAGADAQGDRLFGFENLVGSSYGDSLLGSAAANRLEGGNGADYLKAEGGADKLFGGAGADTLVGGMGKDELTGGTQADLFGYFSTAESSPVFAGWDIIQDFNHSQGDQISLATIDAKTGKDGNQTFQFIGDDAFTKAGQVRSYQEGGVTWVEANTTGAGGAEMKIALEDVSSLTATDFIL